jgi:hypothetical protein
MAKTGLGVVLMVAVGALLARDAFPAAFPAHAQRLLAALPLTLVAVSYLVYQDLRQPGPRELLKAVLLAVAFMLWAANQLMSPSRLATLFNDIAIVLFALDVFLVMVGWPRAKHIRHVGDIPEESIPSAPNEAEPEDAKNASKVQVSP